MCLLWWSRREVTHLLKVTCIYLCINLSLGHPSLPGPVSVNSRLNRIRDLPSRNPQSNLRRRMELSVTVVGFVTEQGCDTKGTVRMGRSKHWLDDVQIPEEHWAICVSCHPGWPQTYSVAKDGLELRILLSLPLSLVLGQNRCISSHAFYAVLGGGTQGFMLARQSLHQLAQGWEFRHSVQCSPLCWPRGNGVSFAEAEMWGSGGLLYLVTAGQV